MRRFHNIPIEWCRKNKKVNELKAKQFILEKLESAMAEDKKNGNIKRVPSLQSQFPKTKSVMGDTLF